MICTVYEEPHFSDYNKPVTDDIILVQYLATERTIFSRNKHV